MNRIEKEPIVINTALHYLVSELEIYPTGAGRVSMIAGIHPVEYWVVEFPIVSYEEQEGQKIIERVLVQQLSYGLCPRTLIPIEMLATETEQAE